MIIFVGMSGAGKGTQSEMLTRENGYAYLATGDMLRRFASPGQKARMLSGQLLSDEEMFVLVEEALKSQPDPNRVVLDGFPRTAAQAAWLIDNASSGHYTIEAVIHLAAKPDVVRVRLQARGREDDTLDAINARLDWYESYTLPVIALFRSRGCPVLSIDGNGASEDIHRDIMENLVKHLEGKTA